MLIVYFADIVIVINNNRVTRSCDRQSCIANVGDNYKIFFINNDHTQKIIIAHQYIKRPPNTVYSRVAADGGMVMAGNISTQEICENTKLAREMALVGNYDSAGIYYEGVTQMLNKLLITLHDPIKKGKWTMVSSLIRVNGNWQ